MAGVAWLHPSETVQMLERECGDGLKLPFASSWVDTETARSLWNPAVDNASILN